jgi:flagellum-specific ATP synthase
MEASQAREMQPNWDIHPYTQFLDRIEGERWQGRVTETVGLLIESQGPPVALGDFCEIRVRGGRALRTQAVGFRNGKVLSMPLEETDGLQLGDQIYARSEDARVAVGPGLLGRVLDGFGQPMDGGPPVQAAAHYNLYAAPPGPMERVPIEQPIATGVRAIDSFLRCGRGQRIGVFGGSGVGKSTLLGTLARSNDADVTVLALIGERNREVRDFLEKELTAEGLSRAVVVVATSDRPAPLRLRACFVALAVAEYFRDQGKSVLLVADSVTRLAMAQREIGLAAGEPPSQKGYTPSVFNLLPKIFERAGSFQSGSITGIFTVLVEGDDFNEPISDAVRGILDGHIILSRQLAARGHYPAIDVLQSISRLATRVSGKDQREAARKLREAMATFQSAEDLIRLGAYANGSNPKLDAAIAVQDHLNQFLRQEPDEQINVQETLSQLTQLAQSL